MRLCGPEALRPDAHLGEVGCETGDSDIIYTDVWHSMGEPKVLRKELIEQLWPCRVIPQVMFESGTPHTKSMHCLPASHDAETTVGAEIDSEFGIGGMEVSDAVFESKGTRISMRHQGILYGQ